MSEMVNNYCDAANKKPKQWQEKMGVETDEEYNMQLETYAPLFKPVGKKAASNTTRGRFRL